MIKMIIRKSHNSTLEADFKEEDIDKDELEVKIGSNTLHIDPYDFNVLNIPEKPTNCSLETNTTVSAIEYNSHGNERCMLAADFPHTDIFEIRIPLVKIQQKW